MSMNLIASEQVVTDLLSVTGSTSYSSVQNVTTATSHNNFNDLNPILSSDYSRNDTSNSTFYANNDGFFCQNYVDGNISYLNISCDNVLGEFFPFPLNDYLKTR